MNNDKKVLQSIVTGTTHNRKELTADIKALEFVQAPPTTDRPIAIYPDSQYVMNLVERKEKLKRNRFTTKKGSRMPDTEFNTSIIWHPATRIQ